MNPVSRNSTSIDEGDPISKEHNVDIPSASRTPSAQARPLNLPCQDLLDNGRREEYLQLCVPLHKASLEGDWKTAEDILEKNKDLVRFSINGNNETALHIAVSRSNTMFVENLMILMEPKDLELQDNSSYTALSIAVTTGNVEIAKILVRKNRALLDIPTIQGMMPLQIAALSKNLDMVNFLYDNNPQSMRGDFWTPESRSRTLVACVEANFFDVALQVLNDQPELALTSGGSVLRVLAQNPRALYYRRPKIVSFMMRTMLRIYCLIPKPNLDPPPGLTLLRIILTNIAKLPWTEIYDIMRGPPDDIKDAKRKYSSRVLFLAAEVGNFKFIVEVIEKYPELLHEVNDINQSIFHVAVSHRHEDIYSLLYAIGSSKDRIITLEDHNGNNMLHLVGNYSESAKNNSRWYIAGPAHQMQRELLWFKEVERMMPFFLLHKKNALGFTPRQEFTKYHKDLLSDGETWMKETGAQLMVVAALLATISFAGLITFAGGYTQDDGHPVLRKNRYFSQFIASNSIAFLSSSASIISVLSLLTSRYNEADFWKSLHYKLMLSVATVIISITYMVSAFAFNFFLLSDKRSQRFPRIATAIAMLVLCIVLPSLNDLLRYLTVTTFGSRVKFGGKMWSTMYTNVY